MDKKDLSELVAVLREGLQEDIREAIRQEKARRTEKQERFGREGINTLVPGRGPRDSSGIMYINPETGQPENQGYAWLWNGRVFECDCGKVKWGETQKFEGERAVRIAMRPVFDEATNEATRWVPIEEMPEELEWTKEKADHAALCNQQILPDDLPDEDDEEGWAEFIKSGRRPGDRNGRRLRAYSGAGRKRAHHAAFRSVGRERAPHDGPDSGAGGQAGEVSPAPASAEAGGREGPHNQVHAGGNPGAGEDRGESPPDGGAWADPFVTVPPAAEKPQGDSQDAQGSRGADTEDAGWVSSSAATL